jgi:hypothetical protein
MELKGEKMKHLTESPFPFVWKGGKLDGKLVVDEMCECKHKRSAHKDSLSFGHAECGEKGCVCPQYRWTEFVFDCSKKKV